MIVIEYEWCFYRRQMLSFGNLFRKICEVKFICNQRKTFQKIPWVSPRSSNMKFIYGFFRLWELASRSPPEKPSTSLNLLETPNQISNSMTDSGISKSSTGSSSQKSKWVDFFKNQTFPWFFCGLIVVIFSQMLDSAIDTGFASSDDDAVSIKSGKAVKNFGILRLAFVQTFLQFSQSFDEKLWSKCLQNFFF